MQQSKTNNKLDNFCNELEILSSEMAESFTLGNFSKIKSIGWSPKVTLKEGLSKTIVKYKEQAY